MIYFQTVIDFLQEYGQLYIKGNKIKKIVDKEKPLTMSLLSPEKAEELLEKLGRLPKQPSKIIPKKQ